MASRHTALTNFEDKRAMIATITPTPIKASCKYILFSSTYKHLTPAFSGAVSGIESDHKYCAPRPPLQRLVRPPSDARELNLSYNIFLFGAVKGHFNSACAFQRITHLLVLVRKSILPEADY